MKQALLLIVFLAACATVRLISLMSGKSECSITGVISESDAQSAAEIFIDGTNMEIGSTLNIYADEDTDAGITYHVPVVISATEEE